MDLCEFKATLGYIRSIQKQIQVVVAHTFNPSTRESHAFNPSTKGEQKAGGDRGSGLSLQSPSLGRGKTALVAWLLCFSDLQLEPYYLSPGFYLCYTIYH